jgi:hypothetical protein
MNSCSRFKILERTWSATAVFPDITAASRRFLSADCVAPNSRRAFWYTFWMLANGPAVAIAVGARNVALSTVSRIERSGRPRFTSEYEYINSPMSGPRSNAS